MSTTQRMQSPPCTPSIQPTSSGRTQETGATHVHVVEALVDLLELAVVRDVLVDLHLALEVV